MKTITTTREYDDEGRMVKETVIEYEFADYSHIYAPNTTPVPTPWWQNPQVTYTIPCNDTVTYGNGVI